MTARNGNAVSRGITGVINHPRALAFAADAPADQAQAYGLGFPVQLSPTEAGLFTNIGRKDLLHQKKGDLEAGTDLIPFDDIKAIDASRAVPLHRGEEMDHPQTGERILMSSYPVVGGFVPLGAKRRDGSPHPHAGTGFGLLVEIAYPRHRPGGPKELPVPFRRWHLHQYTYDGSQFQIAGSAQIEPDALVPGRTVKSRPLACAIPDRDDQLLALGTQAQEPSQHGSRGSQTGLARWRRDGGGRWQIHAYTPIPGAETTSEPSVVRDLDGSLLVAARPGRGERVESLLVWRSADNGTTWEQVIRLDGVRRGPVTINRATDGSPYLAANPLHTFSGEEREYAREALNLWPLAPDRRSLLPPVLVRDGHAEWGRNAQGYLRALDHPSGRTVRLADGTWRHALAYRVLGPWEVEVGADADTLPIPGTYVDEIRSAGDPAPPWVF